MENCSCVYYIYKITLLCGSLKDSYYIGKRKYKVPNWYVSVDDFKLKLISDPMLDVYRGSGKIVNNYFQKYIPEYNVTFVKEIIKFSDSFEDNYKDELLIIGDLWKTDPKCLNLIKGGVCAQNPDSVSDLVKLYNKTHEPIKGRKHTERAKELDREAAKKRWKDPVYKEHMLEVLSEYRRTHKSPKLGTHLSEERKQHLSKINKGKPNPKNKGANNGMYGKVPANAIPILQYSKDGTFIKEYLSAALAARELGAASSANIKKVLKGERKYSMGYVWTYKK